MIVWREMGREQVNKRRREAKESLLGQAFLLYEQLPV